MSEDTRPLDDRLGPTPEVAGKWRIHVEYVGPDGKTVDDTATVVARDVSGLHSIGRTPDLIVELEAGRLARNVMRERGRRG